MRTETAASLIRVLALIALGLTLRQMPAPADTSQPQPPPPEAGPEEIITHVLADQLGAWSRVAGSAVLSPDALAALSPTLAGRLAGMHAIAAGRAEYQAATGGDATATLVLMASRLDALGAFSAGRTTPLDVVRTVSPACWQDGVLRAYSGAVYLEITAQPAEVSARDLANNLALQLEARFPPRGDLPRLTRLLPRRWQNPFTMVYGSASLCDYTPEQPVLTASYTLGFSLVSVAVTQAESEARARQEYGRLLAHVLDGGTARRVEGLGEEGFAGENPAAGRCVGLYQDQFVAWAHTDGDLEDTRAIMRLVALHVRITRPLSLILTGDDGAR